MIILMTMDRFMRRYAQVFQENLDEQKVEKITFKNLKYAMNASIVPINFMYALFDVTCRMQSDFRSSLYIPPRMG
jgi:hypothetical protein